jgi:Membrane-bound toxin component of toxin-antitoxin system
MVFSGLCVLAAYALFLSNLDGAWKLLLGLVAIMFICSGYRQLGWLGGRIPSALRFDGTCTWWLDGLGVEPIRVRRLEAVYVTPWLIGMQFKLIGRQRRFSVCLCTDSSDRADLRRLRVVLRHGQKSWGVQESYL